MSSLQSYSWRGKKGSQQPTLLRMSAKMIYLSVGRSPTTQRLPAATCKHCSEWAHLQKSVAHSLRESKQLNTADLSWLLYVSWLPGSACKYLQFCTSELNVIPLTVTSAGGIGSVHQTKKLMFRQQTRSTASVRSEKLSLAAKQSREDIPRSASSCQGSSAPLHVWGINLPTKRVGGMNQ